MQERIAEDSAILGLGELILKDQERNQPGAGRLDLMFQDPDSNLDESPFYVVGRYAGLPLRLLSWTRLIWISGFFLP